MAFHQQALYVSDYENHRVIAADTALQLLYIMGREGKGPGEFIRCIHLTARDSAVYIFDEGSRRINIFSKNGSFMRSIDELGFYIYNRFAVDGQQHLYLPAPISLETYPILKIDPSGKRLASFGTIFPQPYEKPNIGVNGRQLFVTEDEKLIALGSSTPMVEIYSPQGELLSATNLAGLPCLKSILDYQMVRYQHFGTVGFMSISLLSDAYFTGGKLYILFYEADESTIVSNKLLVLDYDQGQLSPSAIIRLNPGTETANYTTFCVLDHHRKVAAYELISGSIQVLQIEE